MAAQTKTIILTDQYQLACTATASQFAAQARGGVAYVVFDGATQPLADADAIEWSGMSGFAIPGGTSVWVKGTGKFTVVYG